MVSDPTSRRPGAQLAPGLVLGLVLCASAAGATAAGQDTTCPATLSPANVHIVDAPAGWTPFTASSLRLSAIGIMSGPPETREMARPDSAVKTKDGSVVKWTLSTAPGEQAWMSCSYGKDVALTLSKPLQTGLKECTAIYKNTKPGDAAIAFSCK